MNPYSVSTPNLAGTTSVGSPAPAEEFGLWLAKQLRIKKMTQRQLAERSGVDHSTISRLMRGSRVPSLGTVESLERGLRERYSGSGPALETNPAARVEHALRADSLLSESQVRELMDRYLRLRQHNQAQIAAMTAMRGVTVPVSIVRRNA
jgi:transcriptional regulator with XRE-family HTH domain